MKILFVIILFVCPIYAFCQKSFSGIVLDSFSRKPLPYATVYINGTTTGTITNDKGHFNINGISTPARLVVSHINYRPKTMLIDGNSQEKLVIELQERVINLSEIKVSDKNLRKKNIDIFKRMFLGADYWGENAILNNDSVLRFELYYNEKKVPLSESVKNEIKLGYNRNAHELNEDSTVL